MKKTFLGLALLLLSPLLKAASPTWTPTASPSSTPTFSITNTFSATLTATQTWSPTLTASPTPTFTVTPTYTITPRSTRTASFTPTFTPTPTASQSITPTPVYPGSTSVAIQTFSFVDNGNRVWTFTPQGGVSTKAILWAYVFDDTNYTVVYYHVDIVNDTDLWTTSFPHSISLSSAGLIDYHHGYYAPGAHLHLTVGSIY